MKKSKRKKARKPRTWAGWMTAWRDEAELFFPLDGHIIRVRITEVLPTKRKKK